VLKFLVTGMSVIQLDDKEAYTQCGWWQERDLSRLTRLPPRRVIYPPYKQQWRPSFLFLDYDARKELGRDHAGDIFGILSAA